jgi:hypothetical protein
VELFFRRGGRFFLGGEVSLELEGLEFRMQAALHPTC